MSGASYGDLLTAQIDNLTTETEVIAAPGAAGKRILIMGWTICADAASDVTVESGTTPIIEVAALATGTPWVLPVNELGWFKLGDNAALNITASAAINGAVVYRVVSE